MSTQNTVRLVQLVVVMAVMMAGAVASFGGPGVAEARSSPQLEIRFERLNVTQESSRVTVDYVINSQDWSQLQRAKIEPRMDLYVPGQQRSAKFEHHAGYTLTRASGKVVFQRVPAGQRQGEVGIRVVNAKGGKRVGPISLGRQKGDELRVPVKVVNAAQPERPVRGQPSQPARPSRPAEPARPDRPSRPVQPSQPARPGHGGGHGHGGGYGQDSQVEIINACKRNTTFSSDLEKCLADAKNMRGRQTVAIIEACGKNRHGLSDCMRASARLPERQQVSIIQACSQASTFQSDMKKCLEISSGFRQEAAPVILACNRATSFSSDMQACLSTTATYRRPAAPIVQACADASRFSSDFKQCLEHSR